MIVMLQKEAMWQDGLYDLTGSQLMATKKGGTSVLQLKEVNSVNLKSLEEDLSLRGELQPAQHLFFFFIVVPVQLSLFSHHYFPLPHLPPSPALTPSPLWLCPWVLYTCSLMILPLVSPIIALPPPLWLLSVCSSFQCLWLYFACLFVSA